jgi:gluconokinase
LKINVLIALDIGTTNVKAVAFNAAGQATAVAERSNETLAPQPGWSEQDPEKVFQNVLAALREALALHAQMPLSGIVFSAAMHGLVAVDAAGAPLTNFLLWSDLRAAEIARNLRQSGGGGLEIYQRTGVPIHPMSPLLKIIWLRQNRPDVFKKTHKFLGIKEFVWHRLTGNFNSDLSCASATGLLNIWKNDWDEHALATAGISAAQLPELLAPTEMRNPQPSILPKTCPLIIGASDGALANLGSGATQAGQVSVTIGTSAAIRAMTDAPMLDAQMRTFCYRLDAARCIVGGASNNGTNALEWLRKSVFRSPLGPEDFANQAADVLPGADGLRFYPYLHGERAPLWDPTARGSFVGLTALHGQAHFVRAAMEGVLLNLKSVADVLEEKMQIHTVFASGGFARNQLWVSMLGEIFQKKIEVDTLGVDASARGAFLLGKEAFRGVK